MAGGTAASSPMVVTPRRSRPAWVASPTPHNARTGRGSRNSRSRSWGTCSRPSGLAADDASLATSLLEAIPTDAGKPSSVRSRRRMSSPMHTGES